MKLMHIEMPVAKIETTLCQVTDESAGEAIAGARGIEYIFQKIARDHEQGIVAKQHGSVFAAFDHQCIRPHVQNLFRSSSQIMFA